jgi:hypothetical protein
MTSRRRLPSQVQEFAAVPQDEAIIACMHTVDDALGYVGPGEQRTVITESGCASVQDLWIGRAVTALQYRHEPGSQKPTHRQEILGRIVLTKGDEGFVLREYVCPPTVNPIEWLDQLAADVQEIVEADPR